MKNLSNSLFTPRQLVALIVPLIIEQFLGIFVGMADTIMIASVGEAAVSGVSLVDSLNILLSVVFMALTAGGSVIISQSLGAKKNTDASNIAKQLIYSAIFLALIMTVFALLGNTLILKILFGNIAPDVMKNAQIYFFVLAFSYPFLALYNSCASIFRSLGNSKVSMTASLIMNVTNICGNAFCLYVLDLGVLGVALSSLVSRAFAAIILLLLLRKPDGIIVLRKYTFKFNWNIIKKLLAIGIPCSVEASIFQVGKLLVLGIVSGFGTSATTANAVTNSLVQFPIIPAAAIGVALTTVAGQCIGANRYDLATHYTKRLLLVTHGILALTNLFVFVLCPIMLKFYNLTPQTLETAILLTRYHCICSIFLYPPSFMLTNTLRSACDVRYPMVISILSMWIWRVLFSYILAMYFQLGVFGVWIAMSADWLCRSICFLVRFCGNAWKKPPCIKL